MYNKAFLIGRLTRDPELRYTPSGIPVATMAVDGSKNAALFAISVLSVKDSALAEKLVEYKKNMISEVNIKDEKIQKKVEEI